MSLLHAIIAVISVLYILYLRVHLTAYWYLRTGLRACLKDNFEVYLKEKCLTKLHIKRSRVFMGTFLPYNYSQLVKALVNRRL